MGGEAGLLPTQQGPPLQYPDQQGLPTDQPPKHALWGCPRAPPQGKGRFGVSFRALLLLSPAAPEWDCCCQQLEVGTSPGEVTSPNRGFADPC